MTSSILVTVIICTHNPRPDYLSRVLQALKVQTLPKEIWELLLVDNASEKILSSKIDLSWHPNSCHIREEQLGLTPARLRGIKESQAEVLVFVDDDNVLDIDYLEVTLKISENYSFIGAWGGQIRPEFEIVPADWTRPYWNYLAITEFETDRWSNLPNQYETTPPGAGMCVRRNVVQKYLEIIKSNTNRLEFGTNSRNFLRCEDSDLAFTACDIGLGTGRFTSLKMTHLIPKERLQEDYLLKLHEGIIYSAIILESFRGKLPQTQKSLMGKLIEFYGVLRMSSRDRRFYYASQRATNSAARSLINQNT